MNKNGQKRLKMSQKWLKYAQKYPKNAFFVAKAFLKISSISVNPKQKLVKKEGLNIDFQNIAEA